MRRKWAKGSARAALLTASFVALGAGVAQADVTSGEGSILGGNQLNLPISAPIDVSGNAVAVGGEAKAKSEGGAEVNNSGSGSGNQTSGDGSVGGGNQVDAPVSVPVNVCGNAVGILGDAAASCEGGAEVNNSGSGSGNETSGDDSVGGGNQVDAPISAPVNVCGNAGGGDAKAKCKGGAEVNNSGSGSGNQTSGDDSYGGGNQIDVPVEAPVNVCGNAVAALGDAVAACAGSVSAGTANSGTQTMQAAADTSGNGGLLGGNQLTTPLSAPIDACGNSVAVLGAASSGCGTGEVPGEPEPPEDPGEDEPPGADDPGDEGKVPGDDDEDNQRPAPDTGDNADDQLPVTGLNLGSLLVLALGAVAAGAACVVAAMRRPRVNRG